MCKASEDPSRESEKLLILYTTALGWCGVHQGPVSSTPPLCVASKLEQLSNKITKLSSRFSVQAV